MIGCARKAGSSSKSLYRITVRNFDPLEAKMAQKRAEVQRAQQQQLEQSDVTSDPNSSPQKSTTYSTKSDFQQSVFDTRFQGSDAESGQKPTKIQRKFLVLTKLYPHQDAIPEYVHNGTMNRMHDRMRVVYIITASIFFFSTFYIAEKSMAAKISRDRDAGVVVTKM